MSARQITGALNGRWHGGYGLVRCPAHGDRNPSLSLWDCADGRLGAKCHAGCDFWAVISALRDLGLVKAGTGGRRLDPEIEARRKEEARAEAEKLAAIARRVWNEGRPIAGTVAERYLRGRGITCPLPDTLRFHPSCWHADAKRLPALLGLVEGSDGFGIHRTYLRPDGSGKAEIKPNKAMLGSVNRGAVRLTEPGGPLVVAEGIETALSLASGILHAPATIWAALSAPGMRALRLPNRPGRLTVASDGDAPGREAARALAERAYGLGWKVYLLDAPDGRDWNDELLQAVREAVA